MAITYTWKVTGMKTKDEGANKDAVVQTYWQKIGTDELGNQGSFSGATPFTSANVPPNEFVPLNQLTEEMVINWIKAVVVDSYEAHVNEQIKKQLDAQKIPVKEVKLPWAPVTPEAPPV